MGTHMPYGITQCYLPPGRGHIPALNLGVNNLPRVVAHWLSDRKLNRQLLGHKYSAVPVAPLLCSSGSNICNFMFFYLPSVL